MEQHNQPRGGRTQVRAFSVKPPKTTMAPIAPPADTAPPEKLWQGRLTRNLAIASLLVLLLACAKEYDATAPVFDAVSEQLSMELDDSLGKLSFVSNLLPEDTFVFFNQDSPLSRTVFQPMDGEVIHSWSEGEPYLQLAGSQMVSCAAAGEVMSRAHGEGEEIILRVRHGDGYESIYGNLTACFYLEGDPVRQGETIGSVAEGDALYYELRREGRSVEPSLTPAAP